MIVIQTCAMFEVDVDLGANRKRRDNLYFFQNKSHQRAWKEDGSSVPF